MRNFESRPHVLVFNKADLGQGAKRGVKLSNFPKSFYDFILFLKMQMALAYLSVSMSCDC